MSQLKMHTIGMLCWQAELTIIKVRNNRTCQVAVKVVAVVLVASDMICTDFLLKSWITVYKPGEWDFVEHRLAQVEEVSGR